ncbi:hypothetical protein D3C86_1986690 [compost metagenome]
MVNNQVDRNERIDLLRVAAGFLDGIAHGCQIDNHRYAGEVLQHDAGRDEWNFFVAVDAA